MTTTDPTTDTTPPTPSNLPDGIELPPLGLTVHQRLTMIAAEVAAVGKEREANAGGGERYKFRGYDAVINAVHHLFAKWGVVLSYEDGPLDAEKVPRGSQGNLWNSYRLTVHWTFTGWDGDQLTVTNMGEGLDNQDKGLGKARSYALKDLLTRVLLLPTDDPTVDNEATDVPPEQVQAAPTAAELAERDHRAQQLGFNDGADRDERMAQVVRFIRDNVPEGPERDALRARYSPDINDADLSQLHADALRLATAAIESRDTAHDHAADDEPPPDEVQQALDGGPVDAPGPEPDPSSAEQPPAAERELVGTNTSVPTLTDDQLNQAGKPELVEWCRRRKLRTSGSMSDLRLRLREYQGS